MNGLEPAGEVDKREGDTEWENWRTGILLALSSHRYSHILLYYINVHNAFLYFHLSDLTFIILHFRAYAPILQKEELK